MAYLSHINEATVASVDLSLLEGHTGQCEILRNQRFPWPELCFRDLVWRHQVMALEQRRYPYLDQRAVFVAGD